jgi:hypothetical protein
MMAIRLLHIVVVFFCSVLVCAQQSTIVKPMRTQTILLPIKHLVSWTNLDPFLDTNTNHLSNSYRFPKNTSVKPFVVGQSRTIYSDSLEETRLTENARSLSLHAWPVANVIFGNAYIESENYLSSRAGIGGAFSLSSDNRKWHIRGSVTLNNYSTDSLNDLRYEVLPNSYFSDDEGRELQPQFRASYNPNKFFNFQAGIDHNFIGEGERSMLLSDYASPYPFFKIRSSLWRFEFVNIYQFLNETVNDAFLPKFTAAHYLNFSVNDRFKIGLFETVIYSPQDEYLKRGVEWEYLNPFIFYRPIEYGLGSQDKIVIGTNLSYNLDNLMFYGQFVIDDFVLNEIVNRTRWWANKYGGQIGFKGRGKLGSQLLTYRSELNFARPFTFSHLDERTVYGYQGISLTHPLGGNFAEVFASINMSFKNSLQVGVEMFFVQQGGQDGNEELSYGSDIYNPYTNRPTLPNSTLYEDYGYRIGGNGKVNRLRLMPQISYSIYKKWNLQVFARFGYEWIQANENSGIPLFLGGIRTNIWNERSFGF